MRLASSNFPIESSPDSSSSLVIVPSPLKSNFINASFKGSMSSSGIFVAM